LVGADVKVALGGRHRRCGEAEKYEEKRITKYEVRITKRSGNREKGTGKR
jgi:hypothetical protein